MGCQINGLTSSFSVLSMTLVGNWWRYFRACGRIIETASMICDGAAQGLDLGIDSY